jgi:cytochrome c
MKLQRFVALPLVALLATAYGQQSGDNQTSTEAPPPGIRYEANVPAGGQAPPAMEIKKPDNLTPDRAKAGEGLFASMNCDGCHGGGGPGWVGPSLIDGRWRYGGAEEEVFSSIYFGRPKGMPAYGGVIGSDGVWMIVAYLKSQSPPAVVPTTSYENINAATPAPVAAAATTAPAATAPAAPASPEQMITKYGCVACHAVDHKVIGPGLKDVAAKYKGQAGAEAQLAEKIRNGGAGVWGEVPMTPNPQVPDEDLHAIAKWVLTLK